MADRFDKFSERARHVLTLAQEEAMRFRHNYIGTEHLLLGLIREEEGVAAKILEALGVELRKVRSAIELIINLGAATLIGEIGLTPRAKKVFELAVDEARTLNANEIGTEHLLLGLIREGEGIAAGVLESLGVNLTRARTQALHLLAGGVSDLQPSTLKPITREDALVLAGARETLAALQLRTKNAIQAQQYEFAAQLRHAERQLVAAITTIETSLRSSP